MVSIDTMRRVIVVSIDSMIRVIVASIDSRVRVIVVSVDTIVGVTVVSIDTVIIPKRTFKQIQCRLFQAAYIRTWFAHLGSSILQCTHIKRKRCLESGELVYEKRLETTCYKMHVRNMF